MFNAPITCSVNAIRSPYEGMPAIAHVTTFHHGEDMLYIADYDELVMLTRCMFGEFYVTLDSDGLIPAWLPAELDAIR